MARSCPAGAVPLGGVLVGSPDVVSGLFCTANSAFGHLFSLLSPPSTLTRDRAGGSEHRAKCWAGRDRAVLITLIF